MIGGNGTLQGGAEVEVEVETELEGIHTSTVIPNTTIANKRQRPLETNPLTLHQLLSWLPFWNDMLLQRLIRAMHPLLKMPTVMKRMWTGRRCFN